MFSLLETILFRNTRATGATALLAAAAVGLSSGAIPALATERRIEVAGLSMRDAVAVTKVTVGGREVQAKLLVGPCKFQSVVPFEAGDDWLENIAIYVFNRTNKTIALVRIQLRFPETGQQIYDVTIGRIPANAASFGKGRPGEPIPQDPIFQPMLFFPGETRVVHVGDYFGKIRAGLEQVRPLGAYTRVFIDPGLVFFDDGMRWAGNIYSVPDREHRGQWKYLDRLYFPGDRENNLPPGHRWAPDYCNQQ